MWRCHRWTCLPKDYRYGRYYFLFPRSSAIHNLLIINDKGLSSEWTYPYTSYFGDNGACNSTRFMPTAKVSNYVNIPSNNLEAVMEHLLHNGPLAISVDARFFFFIQFIEFLFSYCLALGVNTNQVSLMDVIKLTQILITLFN